MLTVIGEALVDVVRSDTRPPRAHVGGSPMNVAVGLARLGHSVQFVGRYGRDQYGDLVHGHLRRNSVLVPLDPDASPTSTATASLDPTGAARYSFDLLWELPELEQVRPRLLDETVWLHTGSIATMLEPGAHKVFRTVQRAHPRALVSYDPNCRPTLITDRDFARRQAEKFMVLADVVKASNEDLEWLYPDRTVEETARDWLKQGPAVVVVTHGAKGSWGVVRAGSAQVAAPAVPVVDSVGAGDAYMSGLLDALLAAGFSGSARRERLRDMATSTLEDLMVHAARSAAITVSRAGANPPHRDEFG
ncbi:carbohydrate kinase [Arthrobacter sp. NPDC089319]|uniref:carbohydrate kinase family protein n=1 Tax=Arthrobacter sp. NPDC089319 TaxID=3155915 RepID=UPI0034240C61